MDARERREQQRRDGRVGRQTGAQRVGGGAWHRRVRLQLAEPVARRNLQRHQRGHGHRPGIDAQSLRARLPFEAQMQRRHFRACAPTAARKTPDSAATVRQSCRPSPHHTIFHRECICCVL